ncbi:hypothetical protein POSPLADRAFT_1040357 [Postia placenta MAD-698-R-SB12]|uniref:Endoplasmic reticulum junction formation protein lunapark n=1 Tax=Postia placenta MAD-698-R-SB12 TaxID=670580 RepID=A0A1X6MY36_9APHY|nr:hypothetical protein POSPLADRAFT_1040357 [Postia placenta MAD-698-R-SB12]OSX61113.1 hypothetical protein POSPLADRAFT_1040357 [Postia placenta MAD-698-R-SB12]
MVSLFGWLRQNKSEDYGQILEKLVFDIQKRETRLSEIRLRERRSTLFFSIYAVAAWIVWTGMWYTGFLPDISGHNHNSGFERTVKGIPVFAGPILILFIRRIVQIWYTRIANAEEKALVTLRKEKAEKVTEFKQKTGYDKTRNLIERYDDPPAGGGPGTPLRRRIPQGIPATPQRAPQSTPPRPGNPVPPSLQQHLLAPPSQPMPPPRKQWFDKLADAILGDEDGGSATPASSRYALICQKCFTHNGLVKESMWEDAQYVCPKCGHFNPSVRAQRQARGASKSLSPDSRTPVSAHAVSPTQNGQSHAFALSAGANGAPRGSVSPVSDGRRLRGEEEDASVMDVDS